jgi:hypothetical protein
LGEEEEEEEDSGGTETRKVGVKTLPAPKWWCAWAGLADLWGYEALDAICSNEELEGSDLNTLKE